jgi:hypothetical protein
MSITGCWIITINRECPRFLAITLAAAVVGCVSHTPTDAISDGGLDPNTFYVPGTDTPLGTGAQHITFSLPDGNPENQDLVPAWLQHSLGVDEKTAKEIEEAATGWRATGYALRTR